MVPGTYQYADLWDNDKIKVGHAYVLAMMLEGLLPKKVEELNPSEDYIIEPHIIDSW
jgi:phage portal protein BeeE